MSKKIVGKNISPRCSYCEFANSTIKEGTVFCNHKGIVNEYNKCRKFKYDPFKRVPATPKNVDEHNKEEFQI